MNENEGAAEEAAEASVSDGLVVEIEADPTIGYASIQNDIPVIRSIQITNYGQEAVEGVDLLVLCNPRFAQGTKIRFDRLRPSESRCVAPVDLRPDHAYLSGLSEAVKASLTIRVVSAGQELLRETRELEVLAYDQWAGTRSLPELLAAFCMPNNPSVDALLAKASTLLRTEHHDLSLNGYQSKSRDVVWKQVSAIYSTLVAEGFHYAEPPASFGTDGQKIRTPDRIVDGRMATCLDLAMLFASCLEQAGLRPVVLLKEEHAWVGVWLIEGGFVDPLTDDVQAVRKRVDSGEFLVFETTGIAQHHSRRASLRMAMEQGQAHLQDEHSFRYAVDVHRARELRIRPLPSRAVHIAKGPAEAMEERVWSGIEPTPALPPIDPESMPGVEYPTTNTPEGRLAHWKSKLLDLSLRNRLLNFKATKATLQFVVPDPAGLEDALADSARFRIKPLPELMEGRDPRSAEVHRGRTGSAPLDEVARALLARKELLARVDAETLSGHLAAIYSAARTGLEEGGANTLYLAIGMLRWADDAKSEATHVAPILLVPVTLERRSIQSGFTLTRHDDETVINPTLLQHLKVNHQLEVPGLTELPTDEKGVDVTKVLQAFRLAVNDISRWEVLEQVWLGIFSFTKYLMWKDLQDRTHQLVQSRVVQHLLEQPGAELNEEVRDDWEAKLDDRFRPQDLLTPMVADASQLRALAAVDRGADLVLQGPPGTGKSQTITNLIAHTLSKGKTVLFVAEKMAALEVVHRRLCGVGLGPFCLQLHSAKAKKTEVLQQLGSALEMAGHRSDIEWEREANRLASLRSDLNGLVAAMHTVHSNGLTVFEATGTSVKHGSTLPSPMPWTDPSVHDREALDGLREAARRIAALAGAVGQVDGHPLAAIGRTEWSPIWQDDLIARAKKTTEALVAFQQTITALSAHVSEVTVGASYEFYSGLDELAEVLLAAPKVPAGLVRRAHDPSSRARLDSLVRHGRTRAEQWALLASEWSPNVAELSATELTGRWSQVDGAWWLKAYFGRRAIARRLKTYRRDGRRPDNGQIVALLTPLSRLNDEDSLLREMRADAESMLEGGYQGVDTAWDEAANHEAWARRFDAAVAGLVRGDPNAKARLHAALAPLLGDHRATLAPSGAVGRTLVAYRDGWRAARSLVREVQDAASATEPLFGPTDADGAVERALAVLETWVTAQRAVPAWCIWRAAREQAIALGLQGVVADVESGRLPLDSVATHFEYSYRSWWLKRTIDRDPVLRSFSSADHERKIREFREADERFESLTQAYIVALLSGKIPSTTANTRGADSEMNKLRRELQKQRRHMPVRQLVQNLPTLLPRLKPCLLMSPLSVAQYLDAGFSQFDLVVFDEASQIPVWDAIGAIARGRQMVVVGDSKQLPPTTFFSAAGDDDGQVDGQVQTLQSILDECLGAGIRELGLEVHYRSRFESLITFSNAQYYGSRLTTFPSPVTPDQAVRLHHVEGIYDRGGRRTNRAEAEAIVQAVESHYLRAGGVVPSLGVVTFNQPQQELVESLLDARRRENRMLDEAIANHDHEPFFVKNLENVQGDERDFIYFSITYGKDAAGKFTMNFGPLNSEGGERRLNVAVTRARQGVVVYSSMLPEQIDLARVRAAGVRDLKLYLEYAARGPRALVEHALPTGMEPDSPFEEAVIGALRDRGWVVHPQVGCAAYRIDIGVVDPRAPGRYLLGIECDGRMYHSGQTARERDRLRQTVLEGLGWQLHRIWSTDWWLNPVREMEKLCARLETVLADLPSTDDEPADDASAPPDADSGSSEVARGSVNAADDEPLCENHLAAPPSEAAPNSVTKVGADSSALPNVELREHSGVHTFRQARLALGRYSDFALPASNAVIREQLEQVIEQEGPVSEKALFVRVARAWEIERIGRLIAERLQSLLPASCKKTTTAGMRFYWRADMNPATWTGFRIASLHTESQRHVKDVCAEELSNLVLYVVRQTDGQSADSVARSVCRLVGMARVSAQAESAVREVIPGLLNTGRLRESDGRLTALGL